MNKSRLQIAKPDIVKYFDALPGRVLKLTEIASILTKERAFWRLAQSTTTPDFIRFLTESANLKRLDFPFPYRSETRYVWGEVPLLEVLLTLKKDAYFTHYTAVRMHGLTEQVPKIIYLNHEQRPQPQNPHLEQGRITAAFSRRPRMSQNTIDFHNVSICMINGMHTNQLGVITDELTYDTDVKAKVRLTNVERTLIDIAVRPAYSGGVFENLKAYTLAKDRVSVNALAAMLQKLKYVYPYHQAIGYYLERAGYKSTLIDLLRRFPIEFDFYLAHQIGETEYIKEWKLYVPKGF
jgi:predicted transcriptional regulator of viral defense system